MAGAIIGAIIGGSAFTAGSAFFGTTFLASAFTGASLGNMWDQHKAAKKQQAEMEQARQDSLKLSSSNTKQSDTPIALIYGSCRVAGNIVYDSALGNTSGVKDMTWIVSLGEGEISSISSVKLNDKEVAAYPGCSYSFHAGILAQAADNRYLSENFSNTAFLALTLHASDDLTGTPTVTSIVNGLKILVWNKTSKSLVRQFSRNPVWVLYDVMTNIRYGAGIDPKRIDLDTFIECADYCDYMIDNGSGVMEPRFVFDAVINEIQDAEQLMASIAASFRAFLVCIEGKYKLRIEKAELPTQSFEEGNTIIQGSMSINRASRTDNFPNRIIVQYVDPVHWSTDEYTLDDDEDIALRGISDKTLSFIGIVRPTQAARTANYIRDMMNLCSNFMEFKVPFEKIECEPGDVIKVTHSLGGYKDKLARVLAIELDEEFQLKLMCREYNAEVYSDDPNKYQVTSTSSFNGTPFTPPNVNALIAVETGYMTKDGVHVSDVNISWEPMIYPSLKYYESYYQYEGSEAWILNSYTQSSSSIIRNANTNKKMRVKVVTVSEWNRRSSGTVTDYLEIVGKDTPPPDVTGLTASVNTADRTKAIIEWGKVIVNDLRGYNISFNGTTYFTSANSYQIYSLISNPTVSVVAVDNSGNTSVIPATIVVPIVPSPSNVTGLACIQKSTDRSILAITWNAIADTDVSQYEVRIGDTWNSGVMIDRTKALGASYQLTSSGYYKIFVAAINSAGVYGNPTGTTITAVCEPNTPADLAFVQDSHNSENIILSWTPSSGLDIFGYEVYRNRVYIATSRSATYTDVVTISATYQYSIRAKTVGGFFSGYANLSATIVLEPLDVTGFTGKQLVTDNSIIRLTWNPNSKSDLSYYEIREGSSWDNSTVTEAHVVGTYADVVISEERTFTWWIKAVTTAGFKSLYPSKFQGIFNLNPSAVGAIQMTQSASDRTVLNIQWSQVTDGDLKGYQVKVGQSWDSAEPLPFTQELYTSYNIKTTGSVKVMVKSMNTAGYYSDETETSGYFTVEPTNCTNFIGYQNGTSVELYWNKSVDVDVTSYEIREGANFFQGSLIASGITLSEYTTTVDSERDYHYHIKAINSSGNYSLSSLDSIVTVANLPIKNVIKTFDQISLQNGTSTNVEFGPSLINFSNLGGRFSDYPTTKFSDVGGRTVLKLVNKNGVYVTSGEYLCQQIDIGSIITANITVNFVSTVVLKGSGSAVLQIRTSQDGTSWVGWNTFKPVQYTFRYAQFKVILGTTDTSKTPEVNQCLISIDVPDTDIAKTAVISKGGTTVNYGHTFYTVPVVTPTAIGDGLHAVLVSKTTTGCIVKIKNESNTDVGGNADIRIKGY